ncbi:MAG: RDD family protein, partial [Thermoanaerobaculales bacterium]|nr:RDD family protein [Thermoanaerobaculales bacterium]
PESFWEGVRFFAPILGALAWALVTALLFTFTEGRSGVTPGKWVARIRVLGVDLQPCGFGRALVRNLLKCVDGFFNFMVGIMVVALSENWQRVGDMAARTVVVNWQPRQDPPEIVTGPSS